MQLSTWMLARRWLIRLVPVLGLVATGCGSSTATYSGKVSYKDSPVKGGNVTFVSEEGKFPVSSPIAEDGSYTVANVPVGKVKICVETESFNMSGRAIPPSYKPPDEANAPKGYRPPDLSARAQRYVAIPKHYAEAESTPLSITVSGGSHKYDIKLQD